MTLHNDFRHAWRNLLSRQNRAFTGATVLSFMLGIGAATAIFSVVQVMLLAPLPYKEAERVFRLNENNVSLDMLDFAVSVPNFLSWQERSRTFEAIAAIDGDNVNLGAPEGFERVRGMYASDSIWRVLGLPLVAGQEFSVEDDTLGAPPVAILSEGLWRTRFDADPNLIGRAVRINDAAHIVVGIAPQDVGFATDIGVWLPMRPDPETYGRGDRRINVLARLGPESSPAAAQSELDAISASLAKEFPESNAGWSARLTTARDWIVGAEVRERLALLSGAVLLLMLVACVNVANLQLAHSTAREREMGVRQALGAGRARLIMQMMVENTLLAILGGVLGIALAFGALELAGSVLPPSTPRLAAFAVDWRVALLATGFATASAIAFGLVPALLAMRRQLAVVLQQLGRSASQARRGTLRQVLVVAQFALATMLVSSAALLAQQLHSLQRASLGIEPERLLIARLTVPQESENIDLSPHRRIFAALLQEARALPGVESAGLSSEVPLGNFNTSMTVAAGAGAGPLDYTQAAERASWRVVTSGYLETLGVPLLRGRSFAEDSESSRSILLSQGLAERLWPGGEDPVGQTIRLGNGQARNVIGVVGDVRQTGLGDDVTPTMYMPTSWQVTSTMTLALRSAGDPAGLVAPLRDAARRVAPDYPLFDIQTMRGMMQASVAEPRVQTGVLFAFAAASLLLAAFGIAGLISYLVAKRKPELAVRMALGASPQRLVRQVVHGGGGLCALGIALGAMPLFIFAPQWRALGASAQPAGMLVATAVVLLVVGAVSCWLPARRVAQLSPSLALRDE
jgi:putative ABC transport system permease protein